jgi:nitrate/nitrite-specific signal transduction histidine kinase
MALTVKNKIWFGTLFLFLLLLLTGGTGIYYMAKQKTEGENVLKANYESLAYCHTMQQQLNNMDSGYEQSIKNFEDALKKQESNITEPGERQATYAVRSHFDQLKTGDTSKQNLLNIQNQLQEILRLNMNAIRHKNDMAKNTADEAFTILSLLAVLVFLIAFSFLLNFPSIITKPILQFTEAIKEISNKNYSHRIHIDNRDEFGKLADSFNEMASRLQYLYISNLNKFIF